MKSFIIHAMNAVIVFYYLDLFSDSIFLSIILPLVFLYSIFRMIAKVIMVFFNKPMYTKPTKADVKLARNLSNRIK